MMMMTMMMMMMVMNNIKVENVHHVHQVKEVLPHPATVTGRHRWYHCVAVFCSELS